MGSLSQTWLSDFSFSFHFHALEKEMATHSSVLAWRIPGMGEPGGLPSMGLHRVGHDWSDLAATAAVAAGISNNRNKSSHSSGGYKTGIKAWQGCAALEAHTKSLSLPSSSFWWLPAIFGVCWLAASSLQCLPLSPWGIFSVSKFPSSHKNSSH